MDQAVVGRIGRKITVLRATGKVTRGYSVTVAFAVQHHLIYLALSGEDSVPLK